MENRVVITGLGIVSPNGVGIKKFTNAIKNGESGIKHITELKDHGFSCQVGGVPDISDSKYTNIFSKYELNEADLSIKYTIIASLEAWESANLQIPDYFSKETNSTYGAIIGTCSGGLEIFSRKLIPMVKSGNIKRLGSQIIENIMHSGSTAAISNILALSNRTLSNSSACSTGSESIALGYERIKSGGAEIMLTGGSDPYSPYIWAGFDSMRLLTRDFNTTPEKASRPMSATASGFVPAAGSGIIILENYEHAKKRGAKIYGEIIGSSINSGGQRNGGSMTASNSEKVIECIQSALIDANIKGDEIDLICGHLTGTKSDFPEISNWVKALNLHNKYPYINSLKSMTGHLIGAAGAVETIAGIIQLNESFIHPSINCEDLHPDINNIYSNKKIPQKAIINQNLKHIIKASFGFGDVNSCIVLKNIK